MRTALALIATIGFAAAASSSKTGNLLNLDDKVTVDYKIDYDVYWGTGYKGAPFKSAGVLEAKKFHSEKYYLKAQGEGSAALLINLFDIYKLKLTAVAEPFTFHPLELTALIYKPESGNLEKFDIGFRLSTFLNAAKVYLKIHEQGLITYKSISAYISDSENNHLLPKHRDDWGFDDNNAEEYVDAFYQYNLLERYYPEFLQSKWYGRNELWKYWVFGNFNF